MLFLINFFYMLLAVQLSVKYKYSEATLELNYYIYILTTNINGRYVRHKIEIYNRL